MQEARFNSRMGSLDGVDLESQDYYYSIRLFSLLQFFFFFFFFCVEELSSVRVCLGIMPSPSSSPGFRVCRSGGRSQELSAQVDLRCKFRPTTGS